MNGLVAILNTQQTDVIEIRDLGPDPVNVRPGTVKPYTEVRPPLPAGAEYTTVSYAIGDDGVVGTWAYDVPPPQPVTAAQAKLALYNAGLYDAVQTAVQAYPPMRIFYENASMWEYGHPYVQAMAAELAMTDDQVRALFAAAALL